MSVCLEKLLDDAEFSKEWSKASTGFGHGQPFLPTPVASPWNPQGRQSPFAQRLEGAYGSLRRGFKRIRGVLTSCVENVRGGRRRFALRTLSGLSQGTSDESLEHIRHVFVTSSSEVTRARTEFGSGNHSIRTETGHSHGRIRAGQHISGLRRRKRVWYDLDTHFTNGLPHSLKGDEDVNTYVVDGVGEVTDRISLQFGFRTNVIAIQMECLPLDFSCMDENRRSSVIDDLTDSQSPSSVNSASSDSVDSWDVIEDTAFPNNERGADLQNPVTINIDGFVVTDNDLNDDRCSAVRVEEEFEIIDDDLEQITDDEGDIVVLRRHFQ